MSKRKLYIERNSVAGATRETYKRRSLFNTPRRRTRKSEAVSTYFNEKSLVHQPRCNASPQQVVYCTRNIRVGEELLFQVLHRLQKNTYFYILLSLHLFNKNTPLRTNWY